MNEEFCICGHDLFSHHRTEFDDIEQCCVTGCDCDDYEPEIERAKQERAGEWMSL